MLAVTYACARHVGRVYASDMKVLTVVSEPQKPAVSAVAHTPNPASLSTMYTREYTEVPTALAAKVNNGNCGNNVLYWQSL